jgi:hypothetical protein
MLNDRRKGMLNENKIAILVVTKVSWQATWRQPESGASLKPRCDEQRHDEKSNKRKNNHRKSLRV